LLRYLRPAARPAQPVFDTAAGGNGQRANGSMALANGFIPRSYLDVRREREREHA
jgi:hypothetical protein